MATGRQPANSSEEKRNGGGGVISPSHTTTPTCPSPPYIEMGWNSERQDGRGWFFFFFFFFFSFFSFLIHSFFFLAPFSLLSIAKLSGSHLHRRLSHLLILFTSFCLPALASPPSSPATRASLAHMPACLLSPLHRLFLLPAAPSSRLCHCLHCCARTPPYSRTPPPASACLLLLRRAAAWQHSSFFSLPAKASSRNGENGMKAKMKREKSQRRLMQ